MSILSPSNFRSYREYNLENKKLLVRIDINLPISRDGKVESFYKVRKYMKTIDVFSDSAIVLVSHQGRVGDDNFISLEQHGEYLYNLLGDRFNFVMDIIGEKAIDYIKRLKPGHVLLLDNVRLLSEETMEGSPDELSKTIFVSRLYKYFDYFVNDAFGAIHRAHTSLIGFPPVLKSMIGPLMEEELMMLDKFLSERSGCVYILGGSKLETKIRVMENILRFNPNAVFLIGGMVSIAMHAIYGSIPKKEVKGILDGIDRRIIDSCRVVIEEFGDRIYLPIDYRYVKDGVLIEKSIENYSYGDPIQDIGPKTVEKYLDIIKGFKRVFINGPMGIIENSLTRWGTEEILKGIANINIYKVVGGGHMISSLEKLGLLERYDYVSTGGGSLLTLLSGEIPMPLKILMK
ncbi:MAG TPA: phosphoglycerate kinase [Thermoprotei archaeon]|nr:phosphoglycerate kinase [Thermoprotei archaeon]